MAKLSSIAIGFIVISAIAIVLIGFITELTLNYGISNVALMNDSGGLCGASNTNRAIQSINSLFQNKTVDAGTYAPGQINAQVGDSVTTATQASGLVVTLKTAVAPLTLTKAMMSDMGCALGMPPTLITALEIVFAILILFVIAGLFYFRPI